MFYASKTGNNKLFLLKQLMTFKYKEGSPILDHINDFQGFLDQLCHDPKRAASDTYTYPPR